MTAKRLLDTLSTLPGGISGPDYAAQVSASVKSLWDLNGGILASVSGTNTIAASPVVTAGFVAYTDGLRCGFFPAANNTGTVTLNLAGLGAKSVVRRSGANLSAGDLVAGEFTEVVFVNSLDKFVLVKQFFTLPNAGIMRAIGSTVRRSQPLESVNLSTGTPVTATDITHQARGADSVLRFTLFLPYILYIGPPEGFPPASHNLTLTLQRDGVNVLTVYNQSLTVGIEQRYIYEEFLHSPLDTLSHTYRVMVTSSTTNSGTRTLGPHVLLTVDELGPNQ